MRRNYAAASVEYDLLNLATRARYAPNHVDSPRGWRNELMGMLAADLGLEIIPVGSVTRGTAVYGFSDFDYFAIIGSGLMDPPSLALSTLTARLHSHLGRDNHYIVTPPTVSVGGPMLATDVEFTPAYRLADHVFLIPDPDGAETWIESDPRLLTRAFEYAQRRYPYAGELVRILKVWKHLGGHPVRSIYLECIVAQLSSTLSGKSLQEALWLVANEVARSGWCERTILDSRLVVTASAEADRWRLPDGQDMLAQWDRVMWGTAEGAIEVATESLVEFFGQTGKRSLSEIDLPNPSRSYQGRRTPNERRLEKLTARLQESRSARRRVRKKR